MALLDTLTQRPVVILLAMLGAVLVTLGGYLRKKRTEPSPFSNLHRNLTYLGYAATGISVLLFIAAGFRSAYTG